MSLSKGPNNIVDNEDIVGDGLQVRLQPEGNQIGETSTKTKLQSVNLDNNESKAIPPKVDLSLVSNIGKNPPNINIPTEGKEKEDTLPPFKCPFYASDTGNNPFLGAPSSSSSETGSLSSWEHSPPNESDQLQFHLELDNELSSIDNVKKTPIQENRFKGVLIRKPSRDKCPLITFKPLEVPKSNLKSIPGNNLSQLDLASFVKETCKNPFLAGPSSVGSETDESSLPDSRPVSRHSDDLQFNLELDDGLSSGDKEHKKSPSQDI